MSRTSLVLLLTAAALNASDWPMWRCDAGRTAATAQTMPQKMDLLWSWDLPALRPAFKETRLQFDAGYEPVVVGKTLVMGSSREDCVMAFDTDTGAMHWKALADGPVRFAPVIEGGLVIFGADDGVVRAVKLETGALVWKKKLVPSDRLLLGNQRMISVWPVRGGVVAHEGKVYLAAGVWPMEGTFVFCLDAKTGDQVWINDRSCYLYGVHPHATEARGGIAPQGYLLIDGDDLVVPCSTAYPARLDLKTGELKEFELPSAGRLTGGWFAATLDEMKSKQGKARGLVFDKAVSAKRHEDKPRAEGKIGIQRSLRAGGKEWSFDFAWPKMKGKAHSVVVADDKCFVTTDAGELLAYGAGNGASKHWMTEADVQLGEEALATSCIKAAGTERGWVLVVGGGKPGFVESLVKRSQYQVIVLSDDGGVRVRLRSARLYGDRAAVLNQDVSLPPYFADVIIALDGGHEPYVRSLRPNGGKIVGPGAKIIQTRSALDKSTNYLADWNTSADPLVRAPLGVLWFDDALSNFKRAPQPKIVDGVMITADKDWLDASNRKGKLDYRLKAPVFSDIYTGRVLDEYEVPELRAKYGTIDQQTVQQAQYHPPTQKNDWAPDQPRPGMRINPLTGEEEPRVFPKAYGCDGGFDYGGIYTFRSGTAAFYDKRVESGTIHISGPRSGCTNSIVPAGGILSVPYFFEGCTCSYPLPMALALTSLPQNYEQWATWGTVPADSLKGKIQRVGINFGAPGDRKTEDGTLWLDFPSVGGPSPEIDIKTEPAAPEYFYRHSLFIQGGKGWPWVAASGVKGLKRVTVSGLRNGDYTVRMVFCSPDANKRVQSVSLQGVSSFKDISPMEMMAQTESAKAAVSDGTLRVDLVGDTLLCGMELIRDGLRVDALPDAAPVRRW